MTNSRQSLLRISIVIPKGVVKGGSAPVGARKFPEICRFHWSRGGGAQLRPWTHFYLILEVKIETCLLEFHYLKAVKGYTQTDTNKMLYTVDVNPTNHNYIISGITIPMFIGPPCTIRAISGGGPHIPHNYPIVFLGIQGRGQLIRRGALWCYVGMKRLNQILFLKHLQQNIMHCYIYGTALLVCYIIYLYTLLVCWFVCLFVNC